MRKRVRQSQPEDLELGRRTKAGPVLHSRLRWRPSTLRGSPTLWLWHGGAVGLVSAQVRRLGKGTREAGPLDPLKKINLVQSD